VSEENPTATATKTPRKRTTRSPQYPAFGLRTALDKARLIYAKELLHRVNFRTAIGDMGLSASGSTGMRALSALIQFGLLDEFGSGDAREVQFTADAKKILLDERDVSPDRDAVVRALASKPVVYADLLNKWGTSLPSDAEVKFWLVGDKGFNRDIVGDVIASFKDTVAFAKLDSGVGGADIGGESGDDSHTPSIQNHFAPADTPAPRTGGTHGAAGDGAPRRKEAPVLMGDSNAGSSLDIPLPLIGGTAVLRLPTPITADNLDLLKEAIEAHVKHMKKVLEKMQGGTA